MTATDNISLIGMPGAGKSTTGRLLAELLNFEFIDTDHLICHQHQRSLQDIVNGDGYMKLRQLEEQVILDLVAEHTVISTGGSAVYSAAAMQHLSEISKVVYLHAPYDVIADRIKNLDTRGLVKKTHQSLYDLFIERTALYKKYADITVDATLPAQTVAEMIRFEILRSNGV
jgi:shikimate kinase